MSATPVEEPPAQEPFSQETSAQEGSSGSGQTLPFRPLQPISDPSASKRVCFYKSGDYKFSGHRMVINARTFKSFDALLDALSKKVPLPFGVRNITTPRGTTVIKTLDDLHDGGSYVCSDQRRVKPINLEEVNRRQVPWNTTRPPSAGRKRRQGSRLVPLRRRNDVVTNIVPKRVTVRTPKRLVVIKNKDPNVKRTIVLQRKTAPTFDALLDYLSQSLLFPVLKLFSTDGRRIDGLAGLILCSGVVVAAGSEPFRLGNYSSQGAGQMAQIMYIDPVEPLQPGTERYIVNQINKSINGSTNSPLNQHNRSFETEVEHHPTSMDKCGDGMADNDSHTHIVPHDDDIEKSFRVNQDGSMTVEMKVRLTIKEEEMLHWTTTLSRSSLRNGTVSASVSEPGNSSPDSNNIVAKESSSVSEDESKEKNHTSKIGKGVGFNHEQGCEGYNSKAFRRTGFKRTLTPGPLRVTKRASLESVKTVTESGVQENTMGHYSYIEKTADGETTEEYCVLKHSSSSSNRLILRPRQTKSSEASSKSSPSSISSSGVAEVLQIQSNGMEVTETVMHIYESQPCYDNYFANDEYSTDVPTVSPSPTEIHQYVENWLEKVSPDPVPYTEEELTEPRSKVVFQIGDDSDSDEKNECQANPDGVRVDLVSNENRLRRNKSAAILGTVDNESPSSTPKGLDTKAHLVPLLRELYSSIHCLKSASETNVTSNLERSSSLPDFSKQLAGVFGSSCKAFVSFLSVMTQRDNQITSAPRDGNQPSTSEALLTLESLQRISATEDEGGQRASLTDLPSRTSSTFRERWKDFQIMRERLESEPISVKASEAEFALDLSSEGGDAFEDIEELMDELNMPQDLRAEISSTIHQTKCFYPVEESTFVENERQQSDSEEDVEQFVQECNNVTKESPEPDTNSIAEDSSQRKQGHGIAKIGTLQSPFCSEHAKEKTKSEKEPDKDSETSQTGEHLTDTAKEEEGQVEEERELPNDRDDDSEDTEKGERDEAEVGTVTVVGDEEEKESEVGKGCSEEDVEEVEEGTGNHMTVDEEEVEEIQETREDDTVEETDEREGEGETEEEEEGVDEEERGEEWITEERQGDEIEEEAGGVMEESDKGEEAEHRFEEMVEEEEEEATDSVTVEDVEEGVIQEGEEEEEEGGEEEEEEEEATDSVTVEDVEEGVIQEEEEEEEGEEGEEEEEEEEEEEATDSVTVEDVEEGVIQEGEEEEEEEEEEEATDSVTVEDVEEGVIQEGEEGEEEEREEGEEEEEEEEATDSVTVEDVEEGEEEEEEEEEATDSVTVEDVEEGVIQEGEEEEGEYDDVFRGKDEEEDHIEVVSEENNEEEDKGGKDRCQETVEDGEEEPCEESEESRNKLKETSLEEESEEDVVEEIEEHIRTEQMLDEEEREDDEEKDSNAVHEGVELKEENATDEADGIAADRDCKNVLEEASCLLSQSSCDEAHVDSKVTEPNTESSTKHSSEGQCEDDKGNGTDTVHELETDEGGEPQGHPVEISQELLDFVNNALQCSSLKFTYDTLGKIRIEPDNARVTQTKTVVPIYNKDPSYGLKRLPSPTTSDLSDYRPESSESGGYKTQDSVDIVTESGEEASPGCTPEGRTHVKGANSNLSVNSNIEVSPNSQIKSVGSSSSDISGSKNSKEDLSYFSAGSSQKVDADNAAECMSSTPQKDSPEGVLIDQGRWLLKENHLIRKSPPVLLGMYGQLDSTSIDTGDENNCEDVPSQQDLLAAISSSELEEMAKPLTPKCTYYNMPHGSDSDPFLEDFSEQSRGKDASSDKGRGFRVSPTIDTSRTWTKKNGSFSSFASVEFKYPDRKVHPEGSSAGTMAIPTSSGGENVSQAQDSLDRLRMRCGEYCPIL
ncbi:hypothetical protein CgunFtcFv8_023613 [Champsocephalus gunnari]|uniref:Doublecortin domain-containing protein n=1 Tax=Champsocephalus gunnari TaxID=52237 RepID=A0AAN8HL16_CHAGU|nr:hypothetical protein CgunFtcFv8_023613 [Champsocephalus gunnari]